MGLPMAENLMKSGKKIKVFDVSKKTLDIAREKKT
jgi:3-hydroxyisobutyrate dehydrogenase-like beta-hydroxyacid dehydrogenase